MAHHSPVVELEVRANTDRLARKLRVIAAAANNLADELDAIDAEGVTDEMQVIAPGFYAPDFRRPDDAAHETTGDK